MNTRLDILQCMLEVMGSNPSVLKSSKPRVDGRNENEEKRSFQIENLIFR